MLTYFTGCDHVGELTRYGRVDACITIIVHCNLKCIYVYDSCSLLYYTHLLISLSGNSTVVLMLSVKHSTPTLNKVYLILSYLSTCCTLPGHY